MHCLKWSLYIGKICRNKDFYSLDFSYSGVFCYPIASCQRHGIDEILLGWVSLERCSSASPCTNLDMRLPPNIIILKQKALPRRMKNKLNAIGDQVEKREMPLKSYLLIHSNAKLNQGQIKLIKDWTDSAKKNWSKEIKHQTINLNSIT